MIPFYSDASSIPASCQVEQAGNADAWAASSRSLEISLDALRSHLARNALSWKTVVARNLASIAELQEGWDGPSSKGVSAATMRRVNLILGDALQTEAKAKAPYIIPCGDGGVQIEWATPHFELEYSLGADGVRSFWLCNRDSGVEIEDEGDAATELLFRWAKRVASKDSNVRDVSAETEGQQFAFTS